MALTVFQFQIGVDLRLLDFDKDCCSLVAELVQMGVIVYAFGDEDQENQEPDFSPVMELVSGFSPKELENRLYWNWRLLWQFNDGPAVELQLSECQGAVDDCRSFLKTVCGVQKAWNLKKRDRALAGRASVVVVEVEEA
jgi:hypothetical protein